MYTLLNNEIEQLRAVHKASADLMMNIGINHQEVEDCLRAMRFLFSANPEAKPFIVGIEKILEHQENLKRVAMSYHAAVASAIEEAQKE